MNPSTLLLRQVHPNFVQQGRVTSQAFRPTPKDEHQLSVDNGDLIAAKAAWHRFVSQPPNSSAGVMAISNEECTSNGLVVVEDATPYPEHCSLDFSAFQKPEIERKAKLLSRAAQTRGWLHSASTAPSQIP